MKDNVAGRPDTHLRTWCSDAVKQACGWCRGWERSGPEFGDWGFGSLRLSVSVVLPLPGDSGSAIISEHRGDSQDTNGRRQ